MMRSQNRIGLAWSSGSDSNSQGRNCQSRQPRVNFFKQSVKGGSQAYQLVQEFLVMVRKREGHHLDAWLGRVEMSNLAELQSFASGVKKDKEAVRAGLSLSTNNGMVEGQVTKLKLIKRTMYGRAGFALLRQRMLHAV